MKVCIIVSNFYPKITKLLIDGAITKLKEKKVFKYKILKVPGAFEIPVIISSLIKKYDVFIVLGCVIKGKTSHFNYLCSAVISALLKLSISFNKPIGNGLITCNNIKQALQRADKKKKDKGGEAANAAISVFNLIKHDRK